MLPFALLFGVSFGCLVPMRGAVGSIMFGTRAIGKVLGLLQGGPLRRESWALWSWV